MANNKEAILQHKGDGWHSEEIHRSDHLAVIAEKAEPAFGRFRVPGRSLHAAGNASLRYVVAQHQTRHESGERPGGVLSNHAEDQVSHVFRELLSTDPLSRPGDEAPVQTEARSMPTNHGFWGEQDERLFPPRPESDGDHPEEFVEHAKLGFVGACVSTRRVAAAAPNFPGASFGVNERRGRGVRARDRTWGTWTKVTAGERGEEISQVV